MHYKLQDFYIGDEVTWRSKNPRTQPDYDEAWEVHGKMNGRLLIKLDFAGKIHYWSLQPEEVAAVIPASKHRKKDDSSENAT